MYESKDITGHRFGMLTAIRPTEDRDEGYVVWECRCDCGETVRKSTKQLYTAYSCGCARRPRRSDKPNGNRKDITGLRSGRLVALEPTDERSSGFVVWKCQCDCGNVCLTSYDRLVRGQSKSCGCWKRDRMRVFRRKPKGVSGIRGVSFNKETGKYIALLTLQGKRHYLGYFSDLEDAARARRKAEMEILDPWLESHGFEKTSEEDFQAALSEALKKEKGGSDDLGQN